GADQDAAQVLGRVRRGHAHHGAVFDGEAAAERAAGAVVEDDGPGHRAPLHPLEEVGDAHGGDEPAQHQAWQHSRRSASMQSVIAAPARRLVGYALVAILFGILVVQSLLALPWAAADDQTSACRALSPMPFNPQIGKLPAPAPDFEAADFKGQMASLS